MEKQPCVQTPCVMICQLDEQDICIGCLRTLEEIGAWPDASSAERLQILENSSRRKRGKQQG